MLGGVLIGDKMDRFIVIIVIVVKEVVSVMVCYN